MDDLVAPARPRRPLPVVVSCAVALAQLAWLLIAAVYALSIGFLGLDQVLNDELGVGEWAVALVAAVVVVGTAIVGVTAAVLSAVRADSGWLKRLLAGALTTAAGFVFALVLLGMRGQ
jgi:hypothetical protein